MLKKTAIFQVVLFCVSLSGLLAEKQVTYEVCEHFKSVQEQIESRWRDFQMNREFKVFEPGKSDAVLKEEFENLHATRERIWTTVEYERAQNLFAADLIRAPGCAAFAYNNTVSYYNASTIYLGGKRYIACEGPRLKDIPNFFRLLVTHHVTHLVRLTDSYEGETKKVVPK